MSVSGIESVGGFKPLATPQLDAASAVKNTSATDKTNGAGFGDLVMDGIDRLQSVQKTSDDLAVKAATGDLDAIHHYTIAATQAAVTTQLTVAVRNKALDAFNEIMRMPV